MVQAKSKSRGKSLKRLINRLRSPGFVVPWLSQNLRHLRPDSVISTIAAIREVRVSRNRTRRQDRQGPMLEQLEPRIMLSGVNWIAAAGGDWSVGANWSTGTVPGTGDTAIITGLNTGAQVTYSTGSSTVAAVQASSPLEITGGTLTVTGSTQITGTTLTLDGGTLADTTLSTASGGAIQTTSGSTTTLDAATLASNLTLTVSANSTLDVANGLTFQNGAAITVDAGGTLNFIDGTSNTQSVSMSGGTGTATITMDAASGSYAAGKINADGANSVSSVTFGTGVIISGPGDINAGSGNTIDFAGTVRGATLTTSSGGYLVSTQPWQSSSVFDSVTLGGNLTIQAGCELDVSDGLTLQNNATIFANGAYRTIHFVDGTSSTQAVTGTGSIQFYSGGNVNPASGMGIWQAGSVVTIGSGITISGAGYISGYVNATFINYGTIQAPNFAGHGLSMGELIFENYGTIAVEPNGTLGVDVTNLINEAGGTISVATGGQLNLNSGSTDWARNWSNAGTITVASGATLNLGGYFTTAGIGTINSSGTVDFSGILTNTGSTLSSAQLDAWTVGGGTVTSGAVGTSGTAITASGTALTLDGVILDSNLTVAAGETLNITDGLTFANGATITVDAGGVLAFAGGTSNSQTVSGGGSIVLSAASGSYAAGRIWESAYPGSSVTFANGVNISGSGSGSSESTIAASVDDTIIFDNDVTNATLSGNMQIGGTTSNPTIFNSITLGAIALGANVAVPSGSTLDISDGLAFASGSTITVAAGGTLDFIDGSSNTQTVSGSGSIILSAASGSYAAGLINLDGAQTGTGVTFGNGVNLSGPGRLYAASGNTATFDDTVTGVTLSSSAGALSQLGVGGNASNPTVFDGVTLANSVFLGGYTTLDVQDGLTLQNGAWVDDDANSNLIFTNGASSTQTISGSGTIWLPAAGSGLTGAISFSDTGSVVTIGNGVNISGQGGINITSGNTLALEDTVTGATITASSGGNLQLYNMTLENGALNVNSGAVLTLENYNQFLINATLTNDGTVNDISGEWVYFENDSTVNNEAGGVFTITSDDWFQPGLSGDTSSMAFNNAGTLNIAIPPGTIPTEFLPSGSANVFFNNTGTVNVNQGALQFGQPGGNTGQAGNSWSNAGTITVASGATLNLGGNFTTAGIGTINTSGTVDFSGVLTNTGSTLSSTQLNSWTLDGGRIVSGHVGTSGTAITASGTALTLDGVILDSNLTVAAGETLNISDGLTFANGATITVDAGGTLNFVDGTSDTQTVFGSGTITLDAASGSYAAGQINADGANTGSQVTFDNGVNITGLGTSTAPNTVTAASGNTIVFDDTVSGSTLSASAGGDLKSGGTVSSPTNFSSVALTSNLELTTGSLLDLVNGLTEANGVTITQDTGAQIDMLAGNNDAGSALQSWTGDGTLTAQITGFTGSSQTLSGGVAFLDSTNSGAAMASVTVTNGGGITFQWISADGGTMQSVAATGVKAPVWVQLVRSGGTVSAYFSIDDHNWTQIGSAQAVTFSNPTILAGLTTSDPGGLSTDGVLVGAQTTTSAIPQRPVVTTPATASASVVTGNSVNLSAAAQATDGQANNTLIYTWSLLGIAPAAVTFGANGTDAAQNASAAFSAAGTYDFQVTITDIEGASTTSDISVTVAPTLTSIAIAPSSVTLNASALGSSGDLLTGSSVYQSQSQQFTAVAYDQFGVELSSQPTFSWSVISGGGTIGDGSTAGLYMAPSSSGTAVIQASAGGISTTADITIVSNSITQLGAAVTIEDPTFAAFNVGTGPNAYKSFASMPSGEPWIGNGSYAGVSANGTNFTDGNPNAPIGNQVAYIQDTESLSQQNVNFSTAGAYTLSLMAAQRENWQHGGQTLQIQIDGTAVYTFTPSGVNYLTYTTPIFNVAAGMHTITIKGLDPSLSSTLQDNTAFITNVQINPAIQQTILNVFQNVYNNIAYEPYAGLQKGPAATAATGSGNDWDQAALLISDLEAAGVPAADLQFVRGRISPTLSQINAWLGTQNSSAGYDYAAVNVLANAGLNPVTSSNGSTTTFDHAWVQVTVPDINNGQPFYLDPSWKAKNYADANAPAGANALTLVPYNSTGSGGFLTSAIAPPGPISLLDGDFASPSVTSAPGQTIYTPSTSSTMPWIFSGNSGVTSTNSGFTSGMVPPAGVTQVGFIQDTGSVKQEDTFSAGNYTISLLAAQRENNPNGYQELQILVDGNPIYTFSPTTTSYLAYSTPTFSLTAGQHTIEILGLDPSGKDNTAFITNVQLNSVATQTPYQWYQSQVAAALANNYPGLSLSDITHDGPIVAEQFTGIPLTLPYSSYTVTSTYAAGPIADPIANIPTDLMARLQITVTNSSGQSFTYTAKLPESLNGQTIGTSPIVLTYSNPTDTGALIPVLEVGGAAVATAPFSIATGTGSANTLTITLDQLQIGQSGPVANAYTDSNGNKIPADITHQYSHTAGQVIGIGVDVGQWSDGAILNMQAQLNQLAQQVFIDQSFGNLSEAQINAPLDQNLMVGLAAAKYFNYWDAQSRGIAEMTGNVWIGDMSTGITYANALALSNLSSLAADEHWDATDPIFSTLATDMPSVNADYLPAMMETPLTSQEINTNSTAYIDYTDTFSLIADNSSVLEAYTVQEMTNSSAISTVTGFQQALEHGYTLVSITPAQGAGNTTASGSSYDSTNLTNIKNELARWWSSSSPDAANADLQSQLLTELDAGSTIFAPDTLVVGPDYADASGVGTSNLDSTYPNVTSGQNRWIGNIWIDQNYALTPTGITASRGMMIAKQGASSGHGGYSAGYSVPTAITQPTNTITNVTTGDPVNPYDGNLYHSETDINIPSPGLPLNFSRTYNSALATPAGSGTYSSSGSYGSAGLVGIDVGMGNGWTASYNGFLSVHVATSLTPAEVIYTNSAGDQITFMGNSSGGYTAVGGVYATLARQSDGSFIYTDSTGTSRRFVAGLDAVTGNATASDGGLIYRLVSITDRNNNQLQLTYDSSNRFLQEVSSAQNTGRFLKFTWNTTSGTPGYDHISQISDFAGRTWNYSYSGNTVSVVSGVGSYVNSTVVDLASVSSPVDANNDNHLVQYSYVNDAQMPRQDGSLAGLLIQITDSVSNASTGAVTNLGTYVFNYYPDRRVFSVTDPLGNPERYNYDLVTNQTAYTNELGATTLYQFNPGGMLVRTTNPDQNSVTNVWGQPSAGNPNAPFQLASTTDAAGYTTTYSTYDADGNYTKSISSAGVVTDYQYATINGPYEVLTRRTLDPTGLDEATTYTYDANGNPLSMTDPTGAVTSYIYNALGEMTSVTAPNGNAAGPNSAALVDNSTSYTYDASGQVATTTQVINGANTIATNSYDPIGDLTSAQDFNGNITTYSYDNLGELTSMTAASGTAGAATTTYGYYDGKKISVTDPNGNITRYVYNLIGQLVQTINPDGTATEITYTPTGNVSTRTDENGNTTDYLYNAEAQVIDTLNPDGSFTLNILNGDGQTLTQFTPRGVAVPYGSVFNPGNEETTVTTYNRAGESASVTDATGGQTIYGYDNAGNTVSVTDPNGNTTTYQYDAMNRKIGEVAPVNNGTPLLPDGEFSTPVLSQGTYQQDPTGSSWTFGGASGISTNGSGFTNANVNTPVGSQVAYLQFGGENVSQFDTLSAGDYAISLYAAQRSFYNHGGQTLEITVKDQSGNQVMSYTFTPKSTTYQLYRTPTFNLINTGGYTITIAGTDPNGLDNTAFITDVQIGAVTTWTYDANGNQTSVTDPNGNTTTYQYDSANRKISQTSPVSGGTPLLPDGNFTAPFVGSTAIDYGPNNGWSDQDIGNPGVSGYASFGGTWTVAGGGADIWNTSDQFNFASENFTGDSTIIAQVTSQTDTNAWAKAGVMMRDTNAAGSMFADVMVTPAQGVAFMWRNATGGTCQIDAVAGITAPAWVKLTRSGTTYTGYYSTDGTTWIELGSAAITFSSNTNLTGLAVTSHDPGATSTATFANVSVSGSVFSALPGWQSYGNAGVTGNNSSMTSGNPTPPDGAAQVGFIQDISSFSQNINFSAAGDYALSFLAAQRENGNNGGQTLEILIDGNIVGTVSPEGFTYQLYRTATFSLTAGMHTITIQGLDPSLKDNTAFITDVQMGAVTTWTYDANGNQTSVTDPNGNTTTYRYDALNRKIEQVSPTNGGTPLLPNGDFSTPALASGSYGYHGNSAPAWSFSGDAGISANGSVWTNANSNSPVGNQVAYLQFGGNSISQKNVYATGDYAISLYAAQRAYYNHGGLTLDITVTDQSGNQIQNYTFTPQSTTYQVYRTPVFHLTDGTYTITFTSVDPNGQDNTAFITDVQMGAVTTWTYDANGNVTGVTDPNGDVTTYTYNSRNEQTSKTAVNNQTPITSYYAYDANGNVITAVDPLGRITQSQFDSMNRETVRIDPAVSDTPTGQTINPTTTWNYDLSGNLTSTTDANGNTTYYIYNALNQKTGEILPEALAPESFTQSLSNWLSPQNYQYENKVLKMSYYDNSSGQQVTAASGAYLYAYGLNVGADSANGMTSLTLPDNPAVTVLAVDLVTNSGQVVQVNLSQYFNAEGIVNNGTTFSSTGGINGQGDALSAQQLTAGLVIVSSSGGYAFNFGAPNQNNVILANGQAITLPVGQYKAAWILATSSAAPGSTNQTFTLGFNGTTTWAYDANGNLTSVTDPNGNTTTYQYNALNRLVATAAPPVSIPAIADGNFAAPAASPDTYSTDPTGGSWTFAGAAGIAANDSSLTPGQYDPDGSQVAYIQGGGSMTSPSFNYVSGDMVYITAAQSAANPSGVSQTLTLTITASGGSSYSESFTPNGTVYQFYAVGPLILGAGTYTIAVTGSSSAGTALVACIQAYTNPTTTYTYDANGNQTSVTDPNGNTTTFQYNALNEKTAQIAPAVSTTVVVNSTPTTQTVSPTTTWTYDANGNQTSVTDPNGNTTTYTYNALNEKTSEAAPAILDAATGSTINPTTTWNYDANGNVVSTTSPNGNVPGADTADYTTSYTYNALNEQIAQIGPAVYDGMTGSTIHPTTTYQYDAAGNQTSVTAPNGNLFGANAAQYTTFYTYDALNRQVAEIQPPVINPASGDPANPTTLWTYDANGNVTGVTDPDGNTTTYQYDAMNRKIGEVAPVNNGTPLLPDGAFNTPNLGAGLAAYAYSTHLPSGSAWAFSGNAGMSANATYFTSSNPVAPVGNQIAFIQDTGSLSQSDTLAAGDYAISLYAAQRGNWAHGGQTLEITVKDQSGNQVMSYTFTPESTTYQLYRTPTFNLINTGGYTITIAGTDPNGQDNTAFITDVQIGAVTTWTYDANGNQTSVTDPNGNTTTYTYNADNEKISQIAPDVSTTTLVNGFSTTQNVTPTTAYGYDLNGNQTSVTDPNGNTTTFQYNALNEKTAQFAPPITINGAQVTPETTYTYDANGNQTSVTDPNGNVSGATAADHTTYYTYNAAGEQTAQIQPPPATGDSAPTTTYGYDANGNQVSVTDPVGNKTQYSFNADNQQIGKTITSNQSAVTSSTSSYDAQGNLVSTVNANNQQTTYSYDNLGRQIQETQYDAAGNITDTITSTYDLAGNLVKTADTLGNSTTYTYDSNNRVSSETSTYAGMTGSATVNYQYDSAGNTVLTYLTLTNNGTTTYDMFTAYAYNAQNMVTAMQQFDLADGLSAGLISSSQFSGSAAYDTVTPLSVTYQYDPAGNLTGLNRYSDLTNTTPVIQSSYTYNAENELASIINTIGTGANQTTQSYSYSYDAGGRLSQQITPDGTSNFTYDNDNQLTSDVTSSSHYSNYAYDANGNRTGMAWSNSSSSGFYSSSTGGDNQATSDGTYNYTYDASGNLISLTPVSSFSGLNSTYFTWNSLNLLTQAVTKNSAGQTTQTVTYAYNAQNQRTSREVTDGSGNITLNQRYIWNGNNLLVVLNIATNGTPTVGQRFLAGTNENQILAQENATSGGAGPVLWAITDNTGSVVDTVNNNTGTVADHIVYDSFGNITSQSDSGNAMLMGFDGYQYDSETGLYYANARYYSPSLGRFISQDPTGFAAGDSNLYRFVGNHPTYSTDPTGLFEGGSAFTQGTGSYGLGGNSVGSAPVSLTGGTQAAWMNSPYSSPTASISPFGGAGPITAPTSAGGYGAGSGGGNSGSNTISFSLGSGLSPSGGYLGNSAVYAPMGGDGLGIGSLSSAQISANLPTAASSAAYMQGLMSAYPAVVHTGVVQDVNSIIQESNMAAGEVFPVVGALQSAGTALSSWGQSEAALGNAGWGAMGMFLGGVANAAAAVGNPVGSLLGLSEQSYNVGYRYGAGAGIGYGVGSVIGATQLTQAVVGQNFATGQSLSGLDRWGMAFQGASAGTGVAAMGAGLVDFNPTPNLVDPLASSAPVSAIPRTVSLNVLNPEFTPTAAESGTAVSTQQYVEITANGERIPGYGPKVPYNRIAAYGNTPSDADRALGLTDHQPPLVQRYYEGDAAANELPGFLQSDAERAASAADQSRLVAPAQDFHSQGGWLRQYSLQMRKYYFGY